MFSYKAHFRPQNSSNAWLRSILPVPKLSVIVPSPKTIGVAFDMSREENVSFVETMFLEALECMMKLGELDVPATSACTISLSFEFYPPSFFFEKLGRVMLLFSESWVNMSICFFIKELSG